MTSRPVALITGASAGLGAEFARALAARGADLILTARREDRLVTLAEQLETEHGTRTDILTADLATDEGLAAVKARIAATPSLQWLINNAGFGAKGYFHKAAIADLDRMHRLHVLAPLQLTHAALTGMVARDAGAIINVASVISFLMTAGSVSYAASKSWLHVFSEGIYIEMRASRSKVRHPVTVPGVYRDGISRRPGYGSCAGARIPLAGCAFRSVRILAALERNALLVIPSWKYRFIVRVLRNLPTALRFAIAEHMGRRMRRVAIR